MVDWNDLCNTEGFVHIFLVLLDHLKITLLCYEVKINFKEKKGQHRGSD